MKYISLFSGIEAATVAFEPLGWEPVAFAEIEPFPCELLKYRYPSVPNLGDVTKIDWKAVISKYGSVDVICGGSPCQSFSIAGNREGLDGESRLMFEYIRAIQEVRPRWFLWENVPGVFSTDQGRAFGILLNEMEKLGYGMAWRTLDAQFFGVAQRRRRVFLVGCIAGGGYSAAVLFNKESVSGNTQSSKQKRESLAKRTKNRSGRSYTLKLRHTGSDNPGGGQGALIQDDVSATLSTSQDQTLFCLQGAGSTSTCGGDVPYIASYNVRRLTPLECERLQGFSDGWTDIPYKGKEHPPDAPRYKALGNSWAVPCAAWIGKRLDYVDNLIGSSPCRHE